MKIAVFENEFNTVAKIPFEAVSLIYFNNSLDVVNFVSSQDLADLNKIFDYDRVFIDIHLSKKSILDGFDVAKEILRIGYPVNQVIILTGHLGINHKLSEKGLPDFRVVTKPIFLDELKDAIKLQ